MNKQNSINALQEALRIFWLEDSTKADLNLSEKDLKLILSSEETFDMTPDKKAKLIDHLYATVDSESLGEIISKQIQTKKIIEKNLTADTQMPINILRDLKSDKMYPGNVPVMLLKNLFEKLSISIKTAEKAILKTYELITKTAISKPSKSNIGLSFRRVEKGSKHNSIGKLHKADAKELYETREALERYIARLKELMTE